MRLFRTKPISLFAQVNPQLLCGLLSGFFTREALENAKLSKRLYTHYSVVPDIKELPTASFLVNPYPYERLSIPMLSRFKVRCWPFDLVKLFRTPQLSNVFYIDQLFLKIIRTDVTEI
jgi:hypothetical protein